MKVKKNTGRRNFVKEVFLSGMTLTTASSNLLHKPKNYSTKKDASSTKDFSFAFFTDIHVSPNLDNLGDDELPTERKFLTEVPFIGFQRALSEVQAKNVDFIVTGGDNFNTESYYLPPYEGHRPVSIPPDMLISCVEKLHDITSKSELPIYYAIGNHDVYFFPPAESKDDEFGSGFFAKNLGYQGRSYYSFNKNDWHVVVLNTHDGNGNEVGISPQQLEWLKEDLRITGRNRPVILVGHVPFPMHERYNDLSSEIYGILKKNNVKLALFGHWHAYCEFMWNQIPCVIGSSLSGAVWSLVRNVHDVDLGGISKGTNQGYLILHVKGKRVFWNHYPFTFSVEKFNYEQSGRRRSVRYLHSK